MVDVIKFLPSASHPFPSNVQNLRYKSASQQFKLPAFLNNSYTLVDQNTIQNSDSKRWLEYRRPDSTRLLDASNVPYGLHRKVIYQELCRPCTISLRLNDSSKMKQRYTTYDRLTATTTSTGIHMTSQMSLSNGDDESPEVFNAFAGAMTIKTEPLRSQNPLRKSSKNITTSWQSYWASAHAQRRRNESIDYDSNGSLLKQKQFIPGQTHFVVLRDSPCPQSRQESHNETISRGESGYSSTKLSTKVVVNKEIILNHDDDDTNDLTHQISSIELIGSSFIHSVNDINSNMMTPNSTKMDVPLTSTERNDDKKDQVRSPFIVPPATPPSQAQFKSVSALINEVADAQNSRELNANKTSDTSNVPASAESIKLKKRSTKRSKSPSKSTDKKTLKTPSAMQRKCHIEANESTSKRSKSSTASTKLVKSRCGDKKWAEPYVGIRFDPPTPPSSPSIHLWSRDADDDDKPVPFEKSEVFELNSVIKIIGKV